VLREQGYVLDHWTLTAATGVSADGTVLVGYGTNSVGDAEAWRADLSPVVQPPVGSGEQLRPLGSVLLDRVSISFSEEVTVAADDLVIVGANVADYAVTQFAFDSATHTAVWRLAQAIEVDAVQITLRSGADGVRDLAGVALDGEWDNPTSLSDPSSDGFPSGDGAAGGDFVFRFNVLPGDVDGDGAVGRRDFAVVAQHFGMSRGATPRQGDLNGDGAVTLLDVIWAQSMLGSTAVSSPAAASPAAASASGANAVHEPLRLTAARRAVRPDVSPSVADFVFAANPASPEDVGLGGRRIRWARGFHGSSAR
jgi:hypothetical protein